MTGMRMPDSAVITERDDLEDDVAKSATLSVAQKGTDALGRQSVQESLESAANPLLCANVPDRSA